MYHRNPATTTAVLLLLLAASTAGPVAAKPHVYEIDPAHTYPSFEADHMGLSMWRGKFNRSSGRIVLDRAAGKGTVEVTIDVASVDFGHEKLNEWARGPELFAVSRYPRATYRGDLEGFEDGEPSRIVGDLTLHGVTRPVVLTIEAFECMPHPTLEREVCGADAAATIRRDAFGLDAGRAHGFDMGVRLRIQIEAIRTE